MTSPNDSLNKPYRRGTPQARAFRPSLEPLEDRCTPTSVSLVADINTNGAANPNSLTNVNGTLFFRAADADGDIELWRSNGTVEGTVRVKDINRTGSSTPALLTNVNGMLFFTAADINGDVELWKSDGTDAGTVRVKDIRLNGSSNPNNLVNVNGTLFFKAAEGNGNGDRELWKSDGTDAGTVRVKDINPTISSSPQNLTNVNGTLFFFATADQQALWKSYGTAAGTVRVKNVQPASGTLPQNSLTVVNGTVFFAGTAVDTGDTELWKSDGTEAGTVRVKDINTNGSSTPQNLTNVNGTLFFSAIDENGDTELWKSDGTDAGTVRVKDINTNGSSIPLNLTNVNGTLFFTATDANGDTELHKSDGTNAGTVRVKDINTTGPSNPANLTNINGTLYFTATDENGDTELYRSDGTEAGTVRVVDINPTGPSNPSDLTDVNGTLFFTADDGVNGIELYKVVDFSDNFNRADGTNLGPDWTETVGNLNIFGNELLAVAPTGGAALVNNVALSDVSIQARVSVLTTANSRADLYARAADANNAYVGTLVGSDGVFTAKIRRLTNGVFTLLTSASVNLPTGEGVLRFEVKGSLLSLFVNDVLVASVFDTTRTSGKVGVFGTQLVSFDEISATALTPNPFGDNFARADAAQLGNQWQEPLGDAVVLKRQLVVKATGNNLAVFQGAALADVAVQARVSAFAPATTGLGGNAGLVARYLGGGDSNYYVGALVGLDGVFTARISRNVNGVMTHLASAPVSTGTGVLRFEVVGNSLKLFLDGVLVAKTTDTALTRAGLAGVRGTSKAAFDNFNTERLDPVLFADGFNRADSPDIGPAYQKVSGNLDISGGQLRTLNPGANIAFRDGVSLKDVKLEAAVTVSANSASNAGLVARAVDSQNYYYAALENDGVSGVGGFSVSIYRVVNNVKTRLGPAGQVGITTGKLRFEVVGNSLQLFVNDTLLVNVADGTFAAAGVAGVRGSLNTMFDDFVVAR